MQIARQAVNERAVAAPDWKTTLQGRDVVIISPQFWGDYWVSKHWIAHELSRHLRTVFVEPTIWVGGVLRKPWANRAHVARLLRPMRKLDGQLHILSPRFYPGPLERRDGETRRTLDALQRLGVKRPIILNFGTNHDLVKRMDGEVTVYYCVDPAFPEPGHERDEALTCEGSDLVYAVSETYRKQLAPFCTNNQGPHVIPHGYSFEHARRVAEDPAITCPEELQHLPRPILGFVGSIHDSYVDIDRVEMLARSRPNASIVLIGPYENNPLGVDLSAPALQRLRRLPNVHLMGPRHFLEVPRYVKHFDAALVLVNVKDFAGSAKTGQRTHFKWLAYLSMGKPVVAPRVNEADSISSLVYLAPDDAGYLAALDAALSESPELVAPRIAYASQFAFSKTLEAIAAPIAEALSRKRRPA